MSPPPRSAGPLEIELPAIPKSVAAARHAVADFCAGHALDHQAIAIAVSEAVTNAVIHAYPAGVDGRVRLVATLQPASLVITVADRGPGVPPEHLAHLFDKFYRTGSVRPMHGMGLGLAISKGLVEAHGGQIRAASTPGAGLTVTFTLPIPTPAPGAPALVPAQT